MDQITALFALDPGISADQLVRLKERNIFFHGKKPPSASVMMVVIHKENCEIVIDIKKSLGERK